MMMMMMMMMTMIDFYSAITSQLPRVSDVTWHEHRKRGVVTVNNDLRSLHLINEDGDCSVQ